MYTELYMLDLVHGGFNLSHVIQSLATYKEKQIASIDVELFMAGYLGEGKTGT